MDSPDSCVYCGEGRERHQLWCVKSRHPYAKPSTEAVKALSTQVGGTHYKDLTIQPIEYITKNNLGWCEGNIVKYITRWKQKGGLADIDKVIHYAQMLKELNA